MRLLKFVWLLTAWLLLATGAQAFDLRALECLLSKPPVIRGDFTQQKHIRGLAQPLTSSGHFVFAPELGLLWQLRQPFQQAYRIMDSGVALRQSGTWQTTDTQRATAEHNRLFLALLRGDSSALERDFELLLTGTPDAWQLILTPRSELLQHVYTHITLSGAATVERVEVQETEGDITVVMLENSQTDDQLSAAERHDLTH
jgi:outer membrane lipoprotein-sorting protein